MAAEEPTFVGSEFDLFARKAKQDSCLEINETIYEPISSVDQTDIEFLIPGDSDTYIDLNLKLFIRRKLEKNNGTDLAETDYTAGINNLLHYLFSQCSITLNGTQIMQSTEHYSYNAYLETLLTYATDAAESHLQMAKWKLDVGDFKGGDSSKPAELSNTGFLARRKHLKKSQEVHMYGRLHADICNGPQLLINGVKIQVKLTKARPAFYLLSSQEDAKVYFKIQEALLYVKRIKPNVSVMTANNEALIAGYPLRYNLTRMELKPFTFSASSRSLSVDNAVLGRLPKRLIVTMVKNTDFLGNMATNQLYFRNYDLNHFPLYVMENRFLQRDCHWI